jgi:hypothetical protein
MPESDDGRPISAFVTAISVSSKQRVMRGVCATSLVSITQAFKVWRRPLAAVSFTGLR